ncbi:hypothetical protein OHT77_15440 [Streptomyces sp. NBC_00252]|uniref:hypothetical protein n=1 Tax=Streptomyces sp. NBC_00252 TaxID=2975691 RepID=UPI002E2D920E|nr:hypothetical protein [Streptomyces sp. NBC_00252]
MAYATVRGLTLPARLTSLLDQGRWRHPGDAEMATLMPWFESPIDFLATTRQMEWESGSLDTFDDDRYAAFLHVARGGGQETPVELPWLDVEKAFFIAVNRVPGDDVGLALDYRTDAHDPRVVGSYVSMNPLLYEWRVVAPAFSAFAAALPWIFRATKEARSSAQSLEWPVTCREEPQCQRVIAP